MATPGDAWSDREQPVKPGLPPESLLAAATQVAVMATDTRGLITTWNPGAEHMLGYTAAEMVGQRTPTVFLPEAELAAWGQALGEALGESIEGFEVLAAHARRGGCDDHEWTCLRKDGSRLSLSLAVTAVRDAQGQIAGFLAMAVNITERKRVEEALRASEQKYRQLIENSHDIIYSLTPDGVFRFVSPAWTRMLGHAVAEVEHRPFTEFVHPDDVSICYAFMRKVLETGEPQKGVEYRVRHADGTWRWHTSSASPTRDASGAVTHYDGVARDITERKLAEAELREREKQFKTMFDFAPYSCAVYDQEGRVLMVNQTYGRRWGLKAEDMLGRTPEEVGIVVAPEARQRAMEELQRTGRIHLMEADVSRGAITATVLLTSQSIEVAGKPARLAMTVDITERKRAERALRESEERFRLLLQNSNDILSIVDEQGHPLVVHGPAESVLGYRPDELLGKDGLAPIHPDDRPAVSNTLARALAEPGRAVRIEYRARHKDGRWVWVEAVGNNLLQDPAVRGIVLNVRDISSRKLAEAEHEKLQSQLTQAQKMESVGRLAGGVAHDFNNMLGVILGHADLALDGLPPSHRLHADILAIRKAAERSAELTRQLLAFARKQTISPKVLDLNETVDGMLKMLRRLIGEDIQLDWIPRPDAGLVRIDPSQIDQILANLSVNARDAISGTGRLVIETSQVSLDHEYCALHPGFVPGPYVLLAVSDNGCGMDAATQAHLFEPFFTTKEMGKGTGLGLATVFGIVRQNDGFINVYSEPGRGTTFKVYLPRYESEGVRPVHVVSTPTQIGQETILLVEDEPAIQEVTEKMLHRLGYTVLSASTPGQAIRLAREHAGAIDLLLTDVIMPEMNGRDLAKNLLSIYPGMKRLFVSGYTADVIAHHGVLDAGVHFLQKPFSTDTLAAKIREVLGHEPTGA